MTMTPRTTRRFARCPTGRTVIGLAVLALAVTSCSSETGRVATVDGVEISHDRFDELHTAPDDLDEDERVGSALILILQEAFTTRAEAELGLTAPQEAVDEAFAVQRDRLEARGDLAEMLAATNQTETRLLVNATLDALRDLIGAELVRTESGAFDLQAAERAFRIANSEVCIRQIQLDGEPDVSDVLGRLQAGETFERVARDVSLDPFVSREDGVGAGGDLGCSAPSALPAGLDDASLDAPLDQPTGPVTSSLGLHVIEVYERTEPDLESDHDRVIEAAVVDQGPELFRLWAVTVLQEVDVEVDEAFGRWGVLPETEPVPTVVPSYRFGDIVQG